MKIAFIILIFTTLTVLLHSEKFVLSENNAMIKKHHLNITLDKIGNRLISEDRLTFTSINPVSKFTFLLNKDAKIKQVTFNGVNIRHLLNLNVDLTKYIENPNSKIIQEYENAAEVEVNFQNPEKTGDIHIRYDIIASDSVNRAAFSREYIAYEVEGYFGEKGLFLSPSYFWYPTIPGHLSTFHIQVTSPDSILIVTQGTLLENRIEGAKRFTMWGINYPSNGLHLVGSKFEVKEEKYKDISIYTYFFPESQELASSYLTACKRYLAMYENMIGPYPFSKFAVVENFFPTGYGMPSYTLLGSQVIRLPFIIYTSLGHEIAHNWWGNSVYVDYKTGNWCEGLTTYFADHYYKEEKSQNDALQYRRDLNRDFSVYVNKEKDFPLNQFTERTESASRAIGYGKCAMVFHQLREILGDSLFFGGLKDFYKENMYKEAAWSDIQNSVEKVAQQDLEWFFQQWTGKTSAPTLTLTNVKYQNGTISFILKQKEEIFKLYVPIKITLNDSSLIEQKIWFEKAEQYYQIPVPIQPRRISVDPEFDLFRILSKDEIPPTLSEIFAQEEALIILPDNCSSQKYETYKTFAKIMSEGKKDIIIKTDKEITQAELLEKSIYLLGNPAENSMLNKIQTVQHKEYEFDKSKIYLVGSLIPQPDDLIVLVTRGLNNINQNFCIIAIGENQKTGRVGKLISHYGKYSYLVFKDGKNIKKGIYSVEKSPLSYNF
jgi:aminopeptidase N